MTDRRTRSFLVAALLAACVGLAPEVGSACDQHPRDAWFDSAGNQVFTRAERGSNQWYSAEGDVYRETATAYGFVQLTPIVGDGPAIRLYDGEQHIQVQGNGGRKVWVLETYGLWNKPEVTQ